MTENSLFDKTDFHHTPPDSEYYSCKFTGCDFASLSLHATDFDRCTFIGCNLSMLQFTSLMRDTSFVDCKITGASLSKMSRFSGGLTFDRCQLDYCDFSGAGLRGTRFLNCRLYGSSFDNSDLTSALFDSCDLCRTSFSGTNLERADLSTSFGFAINPSHSRLKETVFSEHGLRGLVAHLDITIM